MCLSQLAFFFIFCNFTIANFTASSSLILFQGNHVIKLDLPSSCLQDPINYGSGHFKLIHLECLILLFNKFNGYKIILEIIIFLNLSYLNLSYFGQIP